MKLAYYDNHNWERHFIKAAKEAIYKVYEGYAPLDDEEIGQHMSDQWVDEIAKHVSKKRHLSGKEKQQQKLKSTELGRYLGSDTISYGVDILDWWKVCTIMFHSQFISSYLTL
jgi:hypothetical protein